MDCSRSSINLNDNPNINVDMSQQESIEFYASFAALDGLLETLRSALPLPNEVTNPTSSKRRTLFVAHNLTYATIMQLYGLFARVDTQSKDKVLMAAQAVFQMTGAVPHGSPINPIIGVGATCHHRSFIFNLSLTRQSGYPRVKSYLRSWLH